MENQQTVIVIGAGIGGLATAALLAKTGRRVTVFEKNEQLGGRASVFQSEGFTFDMGPSWYLMPDVFAHFFELMGERVEDHLQLQRLTPSYRIFFKDRQPRVVDISADLQTDLELFEQLEPGSSVKFQEYLKLSKYNYDVSVAKFIYKNYHSVFDFLTWEVMREGLKLSLFSNMDRFVKRYFKTEALQKIMQYHLVFLGGSPYNTPALYSLMAHVDFGMGVFYPRGGIHEIVKVLATLGDKHGVTYRLNTEIAEIVTEQGRATGVRLATGEFVAADLVVSNADIHHTETKLLQKSEDRQRSDAYWQKRTLAPSAFILYLGLKDKVPSLTHHNLLFSPDWSKNFSEIFDHPQWPSDPSLYVCAPSVTDPSVAPPGQENLFVLVPMAAGLSYTDDELKAYADKILLLMEAEMDIPNLRERIVYQRIFCTKDFSDRYYSYQGTALGLAHTLFQTAVFRPANASQRVKNLYYVGANTNPGIGMPMCLISAELVYKLLIGDTSSGPLPSL